MDEGGNIITKTIGAVFEVVKFSILFIPFMIFDLYETITETTEYERRECQYEIYGDNKYGNKK